jgi:hypothetical protein
MFLEFEMKRNSNQTPLFRGPVNINRDADIIAPRQPLIVLGDLAMPAAKME